MDIEQLREAIRAVVAYNWDDERKDYQAQEEGHGAHIFNALVALDNFAEGTHAEPDKYADREGPPDPAAMLPMPRGRSYIADSEGNAVEVDEDGKTVCEECDEEPTS
jgi:hypothetical protein